MAGPYSATYALVRGKVARFTLLDACGLPVATKGTYTTDGFIQVMGTKNYDSGDEIKVRQANGLIGVHEQGRQTFINVSVEIDLIKVNPGVITMLTGDPGVLDYNSTIVGWEEKELIAINQSFGLEVWTATSAARCTAGALTSGYMLYPLLSQITLDIDTISDKEITAKIKATSYANPTWGKGPYGTGSDGSSITGPVASAAGVPSRLLLPVDAAAHRHFEMTTIAPPSPSPSDGPQTYTLPTSY